MQKFMDQQELSAFLHGVPVSTLKHWRMTGKGPRSARIGRRILYRSQDVMEWVDKAFAS
jgi:hypothetical protein